MVTNQEEVEPVHVRSSGEELGADLQHCIRQSPELNLRVVVEVLR